MINLCTIDGCSDDHLAKGVCRKHYLRMYKKGRLNLVLRTDLCAVDRIMQKIKVNEKGCWVYTGKLTKKGYAHVRDDDSKMKYAHNIIWKEKYGDMPRGTRAGSYLRM